MNTLIKRSQTLALVLAALTACDGSEPATASQPRIEGEAASPARLSPTQAENPAPSAPSQRALEIVDLAGLDAAHAALQQSRPEFAAKLAALEPTTTRNPEFLRFNDASLHDPDAAIVFAARLRETPADQRALRLALAEALPRTGAQIDELIGVLYELEGEAEIRAQLVAGLARSEGAKRDALLARALTDASPEVRFSATIAASRRPAPSPILRDALLLAISDGDASVRLRATRSAGALGLAEALPLLESRLEDADADLRLHSLRAIRRIDLDRARALAATRPSDEDPRVNRELAQLSQAN